VTAHGKRGYAKEKKGQEEERRSGKHARTARSNRQKRNGALADLAAPPAERKKKLIKKHCVWAAKCKWSNNCYTIGTKGNRKNGSKTRSPKGERKGLWGGGRVSIFLGQLGSACAKKPFRNPFLGIQKTERLQSRERLCGKATFYGRDGKP